jgi:hypothetical protein
MVISSTNLAGVVSQLTEQYCEMCLHLDTESGAIFAVL